MGEAAVLLSGRAGPRPRTTPHAPHSQIDQLAPPAERRTLSQALVTRIAALTGVAVGGSRRAPPGTIGFHLPDTDCCGRERAFLLGQEFAHVHVADDGALHVILPEPERTAAIAAGWAEPHPFAGMPTVSEDTVMLYAPRDEAEVAILAGLVEIAWRNARGDV